MCMQMQCLFACLSVAIRPLHKFS